MKIADVEGRETITGCARNTAAGAAQVPGEEQAPPPGRARERLVSVARAR